MIQRSEEWIQARLGKVTASKVNDVMSKLKNGEQSATRKNYMTQLLCERLTGKQSESYTNAAMQWGVDNEEPAREMYNFLTGNAVEEVGFIDHPEIEMSGASADGLINSDGLVEIKCPNTSTHIEYLNNEAVPSEYKNQMLFQMSCTRRKWCDFVSYDPRLPVKLQMFIIRYEFEEEKEKIMKTEILKFLEELKNIENKMMSKL